MGEYVTTYAVPSDTLSSSDVEPASGTLRQPVHYKRSQDILIRFCTTCGDHRDCVCSCRVHRDIQLIASVAMCSSNSSSGTLVSATSSCLLIFSQHQVHRTVLITIILKLFLLLGAPAAANIIHLHLIFSHFKKPSVASACKGDISLSDFLMHTASGTAGSDVE